MSDTFSPPFYLRSALAQILLASSALRRRGGSPMLEAAREVILNPVDDVRLQGFY